MNTKNKNYKKLLECNRNIERLRHSIRNLGYEKLEKPYQDGWFANWLVREDIIKGGKFEDVEFIVEHLSVGVYSPTKDLKVWCKDEKRYQYLKPDFKVIKSHEYEQLDPKIKRWFVLENSKENFNNWFVPIKRYKPLIPEWMLFSQVDKNWVTHKKVVDGLLEQELAEFESLHEVLLDHRHWTCGVKSAKPYKKDRNSRFRRKNKTIVKDYYMNGDYDVNLPIIKKNILYDMW